jgi:hypothetical protein
MEQITYGLIRDDDDDMRFSASFPFVWEWMLSVWPEEANIIFSESHCDYNDFTEAEVLKRKIVPELNQSSTKS